MTKEENEFEELVCGNYYRVVSVTRLKDISNWQVEYLPISEALAVEEKLDDNDSYYVVNFLNWDKTKKTVILEDVDCRTIDTLEDIEEKRVREYHNCLSFARQALIDMNRNIVEA